jgi:hypothetical protein
MNSMLLNGCRRNEGRSLTSRCYLIVMPHNRNNNVEQIKDTGPPSWQKTRNNKLHQKID